MDVQKLHAVTDCEDREVAFEGAPHEIELEAVATVADARRLGMGRLSVPLGVDVAPARQQDSPGPIEHRWIFGIEVGPDVEAFGDGFVRKYRERGQHPDASPSRGDRGGVCQWKPGMVSLQLADDRYPAVVVRVIQSVDAESSYGAANV